MRKTVAVGVDGSAESVNAARYAAAIAQRRRDSLTLVHGFLYPLGYGALGIAAFAPALPTDPRDDAQSLLDAAAAAVHEDYPDLEIHTVQTASSGQLALIDQSRTADVTVVGHRGLGGFPELMLGSVSTQVVAHAHGPVVVFRPGGTTTADAPVVVGVDGSPESTAAVAFAFDEAAGRHAPLEAIHVYPESAAGSEAAAAALLDTVLGPWAAKHPEVTIHRRTRSVADLDDTALRRHPGPADNAEAVFVTPPDTHAWSWSGPAAAAASPVCSSARSARPSPITPTARSPSSTPTPPTDSAQAKEETSVHVAATRLPGHERLVRRRVPTPRGHAILVEDRYTDQEYTMRLPANADEEHIKAEHHDGILNVAVPLSAPEPAGRQITVTKS